MHGIYRIPLHKYWVLIKLPLISEKDSNQLVKKEHFKIAIGSLDLFQPDWMVKMDLNFRSLFIETPSIIANESV